MKIDRSTIPYLNGSKFSNGIKFLFSSEESFITDRITLLKTITKDASVVHVGCADHMELIEKKRKKGTWLHDILLKNAKHCIGIDINFETVKYLTDILKIDDIHCANIIKDKIPQITDKKWDYILLGEILEHTDNPVMFLSSIKEKYSGIIDKIVITVPNAFCINNFFGTLKHSENINSDHRYWFTPFTISKVLAEAGMEADEIYLCQLRPFRYKFISLRNRLKGFFLRKYPGLRNTLVVTAKF